MYTTLKFLHILGVVLFVGNIITAALWKTRADRSGDLATVAYAQRTVALADWAFTLPGVLLVIVGGCAPLVDMPPPSPDGPRVSKIRFSSNEGMVGCPFGIIVHVDSIQGTPTQARAGWTRAYGRSASLGRPSCLSSRGSLRDTPLMT